jgi:DNA-binding NarL/FixJ family response regulator
LTAARGSGAIGAMIRTLLICGLVLALGAFGLQWLQYKTLMRELTPQAYVGLVAALFAAGGIWLGWRVAARPAGPGFARNEAALRTLGVTGQELKVLERLAAGQSNKEIARALGLSPNTVKTHVANLFGKLEVRRRTQAISKARDLSLIP